MKRAKEGEMKEKKAMKRHLIIYVGLLVWAVFWSALAWPASYTTPGGNTVYIPSRFSLPPPAENLFPILTMEGTTDPTAIWGVRKEIIVIVYAHIEGAISPDMPDLVEVYTMEDGKLFGLIYPDTVHKVGVRIRLLGDGTIVAEEGEPITINPTIQKNHYQL